MYYTGLDSSGNSKIGRATAVSANGPFARDAAAVVDVGAAGDFDAGSVKDPVVVKAGAGDYRMLYTGVETLEGETIERVGYATSTNGSTWTKRGVVLNPSLTAYGYDEVGGTRRNAYRRLDHARLDERRRPHRPHTRRSCLDGISDPVAAQAGPERLGDLPARRRVDHEPRFSPDRPYLDRQLRRTLGQLPQPYSSNGSEFWSDYFPVTGEPDRGA